MIQFLKMFWQWILWKLANNGIFWNQVMGIYCPRCGACGEGWINDDGTTGGCCSPFLCDHGIFCAGYYDEVE